MKLISLNTWGGKLHEPLMDFVGQHSKEIDIFCFQEVFSNSKGVPSALRDYAVLNLFQDLTRALPDFKSYTNKTQICSGQEEILTVFLRKTLHVEETGEFSVYKHEGNKVKSANAYETNVQYARFRNNDKRFTVCNFHGQWSPSGKGDTEIRLKQAENLNRALDAMDGPKVLCGDFNMLPDIRSMEILRGRNEESHKRVQDNFYT